MEIKNSGDPPDKLEDMAFGFLYQLLADARAVSGPVC